MKDTCRIGNITAAKVLVALIEKGENIFTPFCEGGRYDLLMDKNGRFVRIQYKTGMLKKGVVVFRNYSMTAAGLRSYGTEVDAYGVYCPQNKKTYLVPVGDCATSITCLRVEPARNGMKKNIRLAEQYEI